MCLVYVYDNIVFFEICSLVNFFGDRKRQLLRGEIPHGHSFYGFRVIGAVNKYIIGCLILRNPEF